MDWSDGIDWDDDGDENSCWGGEWSDFGGMYFRGTLADCYPLEYHPFCQLVDAALGYMDTQRDVVLYDQTHYEFLALAASFAAMDYEHELKFHKFLQLPAELRINV